MYSPYTVYWMIYILWSTRAPANACNDIMIMFGKKSSWGDMIYGWEIEEICLWEIDGDGRWITEVSVIDYCSARRGLITCSHHRVQTHSRSPSSTRLSSIIRPRWLCGAWANHGEMAVFLTASIVHAILLPNLFRGKFIREKNSKLRKFPFFLL